MPMKILITGSKGLIGSALIKSLHQIGIETIGIDIKHSTDDTNYGTILDSNGVFSKLKQVDGIMHLAAVSRVIDAEKTPELCWRTNVQGTSTIIQAALECENRPWLIYASSREVYGEPAQFPVKESDSLKPVNIYGESKAEAEKLVHQASENGLKTAIVRFSNVYGSIHDYSDRVIPAFCRAAAEGTSIRVDGSENMFDFTYLNDVIDGLLSLIQLITNHGHSIDPIHLTRGIGVTLQQIAIIAQKSSLVPISILEKPSRSFDVSKFYGDPTRAQEILKWQASVSIEEGMSRLINQYRLHSLAKTEGVTCNVVS